MQDEKRFISAKSKLLHYYITQQPHLFGRRSAQQSLGLLACHVSLRLVFFAAAPAAAGFVLSCPSDWLCLGSMRDCRNSLHWRRGLKTPLVLVSPFPLHRFFCSLNRSLLLGPSSLPFLGTVSYRVSPPSRSLSCSSSVLFCVTCPCAIGRAPLRTLSYSPALLLLPAEHPPSLRSRCTPPFFSACRLIHF